MTEKVAIQGIKGSFHHQVAQEYYGPKVNVEECMSFQAVVSSLLSGDSGAAIMAIENSTAGSILSNYALIDEYNLRIAGEHYIPISMNLMAWPGQSLESIEEVRSHPMALLQCRDFFKDHPHLTLIEDTDTAEVAARIARDKAGGVAALASKTAAEIYCLEILAEDVHTLKTNSTRFLILDRGRNDSESKGSDKASIKLELQSRQGSLAGILNVIRDCELDMTKIQSLPIPGSAWKYAFFIDTVYEDQEKLNTAIEVLKLMAENLKVLGTYKKKLV